jgi:hypothetical protein
MIPFLSHTLEYGGADETESLQKKMVHGLYWSIASCVLFQILGLFNIGAALDSWMETLEGYWRGFVERHEASRRGNGETKAWEEYQRDLEALIEELRRGDGDYII